MHRDTWPACKPVILDEILLRWRANLYYQANEQDTHFLFCINFFCFSEQKLHDIKSSHMQQSVISVFSLTLLLCFWQQFFFFLCPNSCVRPSCHQQLVFVCLFCWFEKQICDHTWGSQWHEIIRHMIYWCLVLELWATSCKQCKVFPNLEVWRM